MNCIVKDCPEQDGCMFLKCKTPCQNHSHRDEWRRTLVQCERADKCSNLSCDAMEAHPPMQHPGSDNSCVYPAVCYYRKLRTGQKPYTVRCTAVRKEE